MSKSLKTIPLCQLTQSKLNVRKTGTDTDVAQLAASIQAHGVLENLVVTKTPSDNGAAPNYEIVAGSRRLRALKLLLKRRKIDGDYPVPCQIRSGSNGVGLVELSLAENIERAPLHPADQYEAFARLKSDGASADDIAARFGLLPTVVLQRLKLAAVSPRLMAAYRKDEMTLEQLMAFTISDDHAAQEQAWFENPYSDFSPRAIRRLLTKAHVEGRDRRARLIGTKAYEDAGGVIVRDLFQTEDEGYFTDSQLLDRLVAARLDSEAETIRKEGWSWVEVWLEADFDRLGRFGHAKTVAVKLSKKEKARLAKLSNRYDRLVAELEDNGEQEASSELDRVSATLQELQAKTIAWPERAKASSGAVIVLDFDGRLQVERGLIRPGERKAATASSGASVTEKARPAQGYSEAVLTDLSAQRTAALRELLAAQPEKALTALLERLAQRVFLGAYSDSCIKIVPALTDLGRYSKSVGASKAAASFFERQSQWQQRLPSGETLWQWLESLTNSDRLALLAHCVATTLDALRYRGSEPEDAGHLAQALKLDMADWWRPSQSNFLDHVTKSQISDAVSEGVSSLESRRLADLKKGEMAAKAETLLAPSRWLPKPLRTSVQNDELNNGEKRAAE